MKISALSKKNSNRFANIPIGRIQVWRTLLPLNHPYALALGVLKKFESFIVKVETADGVGWGEVSALPGYHQDSPDEIWSFLKEACQKCINRSLEEAQLLVSQARRRQHFKTAPLEMAIEELASPVEGTGISGSVPLIGVLNLLSEVEAQCQRLLELGCRTLKIKIGSDLKRECGLIERLKKTAVVRQFTMRFDANQSLSLKSAKEICRLIADLPASFLEQPFGTEEWKTTAELCSSSQVPVMLDESIYEKDDILRAVESGVKWIKLKIAKQGTRAKLVELGRLAEKLGLGVIIGNGVATEIACRLEAAAWLELKRREAGEMNGFLKIREPIVKAPFRVDKFSWDFSSLSVAVNQACLNRHFVEHHEVRSFDNKG